MLATTEDRTLYLECYSGISGDMTVAALLDLGASEEILRKTLDQLPLHGYEIKVGRVKKCQIGACDFHVKIKEQEHHEHRTYADICCILEKAGLMEPVLLLAKKIFQIVAEAEAKIHEIPVEQVHFHEVGAIDSIVDIVAVSVCIVDLQIKEVIISNIYEGTGLVHCQHGKIPVPAPAVLEIMRKHQLPMTITEVSGEMITPTGAAIAAALKTKEKLPDVFTIDKIGTGAGKKKFSHANILRGMLLSRPEKEKKNKDQETVWVLETNVDDCSGEQLGYVIEHLLAAGAKDASCFPIFMKKHRPAYMLQVLCGKEMIPLMESIIFQETTSIGLRKYEDARTILSRKFETVDTKLGKAIVKVCSHKEQMFYYPEYDSVREIGEKTGKSYEEVYAFIVEAAKSRLEG